MVMIWAIIGIIVLIVVTYGALAWAMRHEFDRADLAERLRRDE